MAALGSEWGASWGCATALPYGSRGTWQRYAVRAAALALPKCMAGFGFVPACLQVQCKIAEVRCVKQKLKNSSPIKRKSQMVLQVLAPP